MKKLALLFTILMVIGCLCACGEESESLAAPGDAELEEYYTSPESIPLPGEEELFYDADHCSQGEHTFQEEILTEVGCETYGEVQYTCIHCGWYYFDLIMATGHDYNPPTCEFDAYCTICHMIVETATGHNVVDQICQNCGEFFE